MPRSSKSEIAWNVYYFAGKRKLLGLVYGRTAEEALEAACTEYKLTSAAQRARVQVEPVP